MNAGKPTESAELVSWAVERSRGEPRLSAQVAELAATRPRPGSPAVETVAWLNRKGELHMAIAERARALGDVVGAIEAEVLGHRAWRDANDLARQHGLPVTDCRMIATSFAARDDTAQGWDAAGFAHSGRTTGRDVEAADTG